MAATVTMTFNIWPSQDQEYVIPELIPPVKMELGSWESEKLIIEGWWESELDIPADSTREWPIGQDDLPDGEPYQIIRDIPVTIRKHTDVEFTATFENANLSIGGISPRDAFQALVYEILDTFDYLTMHQTELGPELVRQLRVLSQHIAKTER